MRLPLYFTVAPAVCVLALSAQSRISIAQNEAGVSTIRLISADEPARETTVRVPRRQFEAPVETQRAETQPVETRLEMQANYPVARAEYISQPDDESSLQRTARAPAPPHVSQPVVSRPRMPAEFRPSAAARAVLNEMPAPMPIQSAPHLQTARPGGKPFQAMQSEPTISPYLYLSAGTNNSSPMTNYFAFVRPQLEQQEANRQQERQIQQLRTQLRKMSSTGGGQQQGLNPSVAARFMDTGQFYHGLQR